MYKKCKQNRAMIEQLRETLREVEAFETSWSYASFLFRLYSRTKSRIDSGSPQNIANPALRGLIEGSLTRRGIRMWEEVLETVWFWLVNCCHALIKVID